MRKNAVVTFMLVAAIVLIVGAALVLDSRRTGGDDERFIGTDSAATSLIEEDNPTYTPWFDSLFAPTSSEVESGLFALQAALGGIALGYVFGALRGRCRNEAESAEATSAEPSSAGSS